jgi:hypothetical protein
LQTGFQVLQFTPQHRMLDLHQSSTAAPPVNDN